MSSITDYLNKIISDKHDVRDDIRYVVQFPLQRMRRSKAMSELFMEDYGQRFKEIEELSKEVMAEFTNPWNDQSLDEAEQIKQITSHWNHILNGGVLDSFDGIVKFLAECKENINNFNLSSSDGERALSAVSKACENANKVRKEIITICSPQNQDTIAKGKPFCLVESIHRVMDDLNADVQYIGEDLFSDVYITGDEDGFSLSVLKNIKHNIERHAFEVPEYASLFVWERIVQISFKDDGNAYIVSIANNGTPFNGDVDKVFDYRYCYGRARHSGIGMFSAKNYCQKVLGGDITFQRLDSQENMNVRVKLIIPKQKDEQI